MEHLSKIHTRDKICKLLEDRNSKIVGLTGGVYDIIHPGHIHVLAQAKKCCDILVVAVNSDISVKKFKPTRPVLSDSIRIQIVSSIMYVDYCFVFDEVNQFQNLKLLKPHKFIKGGDYSRDELIKIDNLDLLEEMPELIIIPKTAEISTTMIIEHVRSGIQEPLKLED